ncbi:oligopeptide transport system permease protein OppC [Blastopirellula marina DSM 3645]|uniref:Oligopeptide transport system permease protein OppC n=2 Tax=Blastopirellula marina TaxID=124 RepID=A3ZYB9_9BACT|nr:ABC transporter permease [Blastopirellula marina]EAQ78382.1 oligopeptide transport system permease protein OppC [Blastopirellula marina DSM 3645]
MNSNNRNFEAALPPLDRYRDMLRDADAIQGVSLWQDAWRRLRRNWVAMGSLTFLILLSVAAVLTPIFPLQSPVEQHLRDRSFAAPNRQSVQLGLSGLDEEQRSIAIKTLWNDPSAFDEALIRTRLAIFGDWAVPSLCGSDHLGRDMLSRLFWGARVSLIVGVVATFVSLIIGVSYGAISGFAGGHIDDAMMRVVDILYSIPFIFIVIFVVMVISEPTIKGPLESFGINRLVAFYFLIGAIYWLTMARVVRGQIISLKNEQFVDAARTIGADSARIVFVHLVPNVLGVVIVYLTLTIPSVMLFEAFLSFLGIGVEEPNVSWGLLANEGLKVITPIRIYWWLIVFPALALASTLYSLNFLGDGLRDALDPRMKNR